MAAGRNAVGASHAVMNPRQLRRGVAFVQPRMQSKPMPAVAVDPSVTARAMADVEFIVVSNVTFTADHGRHVSAGRLQSAKTSRRQLRAVHVGAGRLAGVTYRSRYVKITAQSYGM